MVNAGYKHLNEAFAGSSVPIELLGLASTVGGVVALVMAVIRFEQMMSQMVALDKAREGDDFIRRQLAATPFPPEGRIVLLPGCRKSLRKLPRGSLVAVGGGVVTLLFEVLYADSLVLSVVITSLLVILAAFLAVLALAPSKGFIILNPSSLSYRAVARRRRVSTVDIAKLVRLTIEYPTRYETVLRRELLVIDHCGHTRLRIVEEVFSPQQMERLLAMIGAPLFESRKTYSPRVVQALFPGSVPFPVRRPYAFAFALMFGAFVLIAFGVLIQNA